MLAICIIHTILRIQLLLAMQTGSEKRLRLSKLCAHVLCFVFDVFVHAENACVHLCVQETEKEQS